MKKMENTRKKRVIHLFTAFVLMIGMYHASAQPTLTQTITNNLCINNCSGSITLSITGGTPPYSVNWSNGSTSSSIGNLCNGLYQVSITDNSIPTTPFNWNYVISGDGMVIGFFTDSVMHINGQSLFPGDYIGAFYLNTSGNLTCGGYCLWDGIGTAMTVWGDDNTTTQKDGFSANETINYQVWRVINGHTVPVTTQLSGTSGNPPGTYITNGLGVITSLIGNDGIVADFTISSQFNMTVSSTLSDYQGYQVSAVGASDGEIALTVNDALPPITYLWSNGMTTSTITGLTAGAYEVTVTDASGCFPQIHNFSLNEPGNFTLSGISTDVICNGYYTGSINLTSSMIPSFMQYTWSNGATTEDIGNLSAGNYTVTASYQGDTTVLQFTINQPNAISVQLNTIPINPISGAPGVIQSAISGGTPPYHYSWSTGEQTADLVTYLYGTHYLTVTDANACYSISNTLMSLSTMPSWTVNPSTTQHQIYVSGNAYLAIDGVFLSNYDMLGVFYDSLGTQACGGFLVWHGSSSQMIVQGDNPGTPAIEGFTPGELFSWKLWKVSTQTVHDAVAVYTNNFPQQAAFQAGGTSGVDSVHSISISGTVSNQTKGPVLDGYVLLYEPNAGGYQAIKKAKISNGSYRIEGIEKGNYLCYAIPKPGEDWGIPSYFPAVAEWQQASTINLETSLSSTDISLPSIIPVTPGVGQIGGVIHVGTDSNYNPDILGDDWFSGNKTDEVPARNVPVLLFNYNMQAIDFTLTDQNGMFSFSQLDLGTYFIRGENAGSTTSWNEVILTEGQPVSDNFSFTMNAGAIVHTPSFTNTTLIECFPNPFSDVITLQGLESSASIRLFDVLGKEIHAQWIEANTSLQIPSLPTGIYYLWIEQNEHVIVKKLMKQ